MVACTNLDGVVHQSYRDTATVNINYLDVSLGGSLRWWDLGYNDLQGVLWGGIGDASGESWARIEIVPLFGQSISLLSFDLGAWFQAVLDTKLRILEVGSNNVLLDYGTQTIGTGNVHSLFAPGVSSTLGIAIEWKDTAYNVGIDNIRFNDPLCVSVPEPATLTRLLAGISAGALLGRSKRTIARIFAASTTMTSWPSRCSRYRP